MACRMPGDKPLSNPMMVYCELDLWELADVKLSSKYNYDILRIVPGIIYICIYMASIKHHYSVMNISSIFFLRDA